MFTVLHGENNMIIIMFHTKLINICCYAAIGKPGNPFIITLRS